MQIEQSYAEVDPDEGMDHDIAPFKLSQEHASRCRKLVILKIKMAKDSADATYWWHTYRALGGIFTIDQIRVTA